MSALTVAQLSRRYGVKPRLVTALAAAGVIHPETGARGAYLLGFQDVVLLRSAAALDGSKVKPAQLARFLKSLRKKLPLDAPLSSVRIALLGRELVVRIDEKFENASGQLVLDFSMASSLKPSVVIAENLSQPLSESGDSAKDDPDELMRQAEEAEAERPTQAAERYRKILKIDPAHVDAAMNLIVLLLESGDLPAAYEVAAHAVEIHPDNATLRFNLAVACEELERFDAALLHYQIALQLDPELADAHFNVAQIHDSRGEGRDALRHMSAYRRLQRR
jgi:tetratricopeptide (TPR) repeat protein